MNNISAINNAPTLVQEIARQVSAIATMIGKVAFAALSYFVATLQAVPPLLPLMIVVIAGVTIAAIIVRNVLYPDVSPSSQTSRANRSQTIDHGSSVDSSQSVQKRSTQPKTRAARPNVTTTRKRREREVPYTDINGRIKKPIDRSRSRTNSSGSSGSKDPIVELPFVYSRKDSKIEEINKLQIGVDLSDLIENDKSPVKSSLSSLDPVPEDLDSSSQTKSVETDPEKVFTRTSSHSSNNEAIEDLDSSRVKEKRGGVDEIREINVSTRSSFSDNHSIEADSPAGKLQENF